MMFRACGYVGAMALVDAMARGNTRFSDIVHESGVISDTGNRILKELVNAGIAAKSSAGYILTPWGLRIHADAMDIEENTDTDQNSNTTIDEGGGPCGSF